MRHIFLSDLVKELLGPRSGATELLPISDEPRNEYCTGQLFPPESNAVREPDDDDGVGESIESDDDDPEPGNFVNQAFIDAGKNFRSIPSTLGISFVVSSPPAECGIDVCVSWGRYAREEGGWKRTPNHWVTRISNRTVSEGESSPDASLRLICKAAKLPSGSFKVSILISSTVQPQEKSGRPENADIIFQPEIRVVLDDDSTLEQLGDMAFEAHDPEWRQSTRQYDKLSVFARGHLCGAYWRQIDPQRPYEPSPPELSVPFRWLDGEHFIAANLGLAKFAHPTLRTDFIPLYPGPETDAKAGTSDAEFPADRLAECAGMDELDALLSPLVVRYEEWVSRQTARDDIDASILEKHVTAVRRIRGGIDFLRRDRDAFLAFRFMQKAMALQYGWGKAPDRRQMKWWPFQLAFILVTIESAVKHSPDRQTCDTIWFPTGGGKTEAYLGLAAFTMAYRRRTSTSDSDGSKSGEGTSVISRYTLRLLTIQQFRRALRMVMACEVLRCSQITANSTGWLPPGATREPGLVWGRSPFSIGLWVGARVTPNAMKGSGYKDFAAGAIPLLTRPADADESDPAQVLHCPSCGTALSFPAEGLAAGSHILRFHANVVPRVDATSLSSASSTKVVVKQVTCQRHVSGQSVYLSIHVELPGAVSARDIHQWWQESGRPAFGVQLHSFNAARPGYVTIQSGRKGGTTDYEIRCPNSECELNHVDYSAKVPSKAGPWEFKEIHPCFALPTNRHIGRGAPIAACTVDEQLYSRPPSFLVSTVDKFARLAFTNEAAVFFGRVRSFDSGVSPGFSQEPPNARGRCRVGTFSPPSLIIQDELHLLEGPLGSTFGLFEAAIEELCGHPKYVASSATIRNSFEQVACLVGRTCAVFPPVNVDVADGFFLRSRESHPLNETFPGRLFVGVAFPGRAPQTPTLRTWGRLLQTGEDQRAILASQGIPLADLDHFWTLVGYFNAVRELAQGETLVRQDIPQYLDKVERQSGTPKRHDLLNGFRNLSSQTGSSELPGILARMERTLEGGDALSVVAATSMFGTGVDVSRLSLMVVHGQPKSASQYIQAVGRIGRERAGMAVSIFRVTKPRDLNHYEYFTGYHRRLPVSVEPITVKPLSPKAIDRAIGSLLATLLRNWNTRAPQPPVGIDVEDGAGLVSVLSPEVESSLLAVFARKWEQQPERRRPPGTSEEFLREIRAHLERWREYERRAKRDEQQLQYTKGDLVVLGQGDQGVPAVFPSVPQSLREVESTINIYTEYD